MPVKTKVELKGLFENGEGLEEDNFWDLIDTMATVGDIAPQGEPGSSATVEIVAVNTVNPNINPTVRNIGTVNDVKLEYDLPRAASITIGTVTVIENDLPPTAVITVNANGDRVLNLGFPASIISARASSPSPVVLTSSPFVITNQAEYPVSIIIDGGVVSSISFSRGGSTWYPIGAAAGMFYLSAGDKLQVTYSTAPNITSVPL